MTTSLATWIVVVDQQGRRPKMIGYEVQCLTLGTAVTLARIDMRKRLKNSTPYEVVRAYREDLDALHASELSEMRTIRSTFVDPIEHVPSE